MGRSRSIRGTAVASLALVAACTGSGESTPTIAVVTTTTEPPTPRVDDGELRIGALIPAGDTAVAPALQSTAESAVEAVNEAGGVLGNPVELVIRDEGGSADEAQRAIETLVAEDRVDAIIGPTSSITAIGALDAAVNAGIVSCSPSASAIGLDEFPDEGLFFRTIASDSLQAVAIAQQAELTGARRVTIAHIDDAYGRPYARAVADEIEIAELTTVAVAVGEEDLGNQVTAVLTSEAPVLIVLGAGTFVAQFLAELASRPDSAITRIIVNDAARSVEARPVIAELPDDFREQIIGLAPQIALSESEENPEPVPFAPQVEDCVNLISLAAVQAQSDNPRVIATQMSSVSAGGRPCTTFAECEMGLEDRQINYNGPTGITDLGRDGDPSRAFFERFGFDADGEDASDLAPRVAVEFR